MVLQARLGLAVFLAFALILSAVVPVRPALAGSISVTTTADENGSGSGCSLREAITSANTGADFGGCTGATASPNTITLAVGADYQVEARDTTGQNINGFGFVGLPPITGTVTIEGNGATIRRAGGAPSFRLLVVADTGNLTLRNVTLRDGLARGGDGGNAGGSDGGGGGGGAGLGGAIYVRGTLVVESSTLTANTARGGDGGDGATNAGGDDEGGGGGGGMGGNGGDAGRTGSGDDGGAGGGGFGGDGGSVGSSADGGGGGGGTLTDGADSPAAGSSGGAGGTLNGGAGGGNVVGGSDGGFGGGGGGSGNQSSTAGGAGGFGGGGGGGGDNDAGGAGGFGGGGGGSEGASDAGAAGGFGGGGGGGGGGASGGAGGFFAGAGGSSGDGGGGGGAGLGGAIFVDQGGTLTARNSTFSANTAEGGVGGAGTPSARDGGDGDGRGGAIYTRNGSVTLSNVTVNANVAAQGAAVEAFADGQDATLVLQRTIVANTTGLFDCMTVSGSGTIQPGGSADNLVETTDTASGPCSGISLTSDPNLAALVVNAPGQTATHALNPGSPAIDAVVGACPPEAVDQRGVTRPQDGDNAGPVRCDIGAFERAPGALQFGSPTYTVAENGVTAAITVTRTNGTEGAVGATVSLANGTATATADYDATPLTVSFASGESGTKTVNVPITNDALDEPDETVNLALASPTGGAAIGAQGSAVLTIQDDDAQPTLSINDVSQAEGNAGTTSFVFTVTLSAASAQQVTVQAGTADGTATAASGDYTATGPQTLTFPPNTTTQTFTVPVAGDLFSEPDETFAVNLSGAVNATIADAQGVGTIQDDDGVAGLRVSDAVVTEGDAGTATLTFTVTLSPASSTLVTVPYTIGDQTASGGPVCGPNVDFVNVGGTVTFQPLDTSETIAVTVCADTLVEGNETLVVNLGIPTGGATVADGQGVGTIVDDDAAGVVSFTTASVQVPENAGSVTLTVQRSGGTGPSATGTTTPGSSVASGSVRPGPPASPSAGTIAPSAVGAVTVSFATANGEAVAGQDYGAASGVLTFGVNETTKTITIPILADSLQEGPETFLVTLANPTGGATLGQPATIVVTIIDTTHGAAGSPGDDDADAKREERERETEEERRQRARTNRGNKDDDSVEGDVIETRCDQVWPAVVIANRDGAVEVKLLKEAQAACKDIRVGDYLEADGEKQHEGLFHADSVEIKRRR